jgi:ATP/maltotriose-dependent transcriptional regulator MalT
MNLLSVARSTIPPAQLAWVRDWHDREDPDRALRALLDWAWHAARAMKGADIIAAATLLRDAFQHRDRFRHDFPGDEVETLLALGSLWNDDIDEAIEHARSVWSRGSAARYRPVLATILKLGFWRKRDFMPFYELSQRKTLHGNAMSLLTSIVNLSIEAAAEAEQLRFKLAEHLATDALLLCNKLTGKETYAALLPTCVLAQLHYEAGAVEEADILLRGRLTAIEESGALESSLIAYVLSARVAAARGNRNVALLLLQRGNDIGMQQCWPRLVLRCKAEEVALHIQAEHADLAEACLKQLRHYADGLGVKNRLRDIDAWPLHMASLRLQMANGPSVSTIRSLDDLRSAALQRNHPALVVKLTILLSNTLYMLGHVTRADEELLAALQQGASAGLFRSFIDEMPLIEAQLKQWWWSSDTRSLGHLGPYLGRLLNAPAMQPPTRKKFRSNHRLVESLSTRETIILRLMSLGLSNKSIARELQVTPETVKSHAKHIFIKLASKNRAEAVSRATELGLM